jgi:hypothetical protein
MDSCFSKKKSKRGKENQHELCILMGFSFQTKKHQISNKLPPTLEEHQNTFNIGQYFI